MIYDFDNQIVKYGQTNILIESTSLDFKVIGLTTIVSSNGIGTFQNDSLRFYGIPEFETGVFRISDSKIDIEKV